MKLLGTGAGELRATCNGGPGSDNEWKCASLPHAVRTRGTAQHIEG